MTRDPGPESDDPTPEALRIRRAVAADCPALTDLALRAKAHWGYPEAWMDAWKPSLAFTPATLSGLAVWVAERPTGPVGVIAAAFDAVGGHGEIEHLWVDPRAHGHGIGARLMTVVEAEAAARGVRFLRIVSDPNAVGFYRRRGASVVGSVSAPVCGTPRVLPLMHLVLRPPTEASPNRS